MKYCNTQSRCFLRNTTQNICVCFSALIVYLAAVLMVKPVFSYQLETVANEANGETVKWDSSAIEVYLNRDGSRDVSLAPLYKAIQASLDVWNSIDCGNPQLKLAGVTFKEEASFDTTNAIIFKNEWMPEASGALALTTVYADQNSSHILETDIEFNQEEFVFSIAANGPAYLHDIENTLVHELGHVLGIDHPDVYGKPDVPYATMNSSAPVAEITKSSLEADDILGICALYLTKEKVKQKKGDDDTSDSDSGCAVIPR